MSSLWWLALALVALPLWWHRQKREQAKAKLLATARFLPGAEPKQVRVWRWNDPILLLVRCLLLACLAAWLADPVIAWRRDTVLVAAGAGKAWVERQVADARFGGAERVTLPAAELLPWLRAHEREWRSDARLLVVGDVPMPAVQPSFSHRVELRTQSMPVPKAERHVAIVSGRAAEWRRMLASLDGPQRFVIQDAPDGTTDLVIWDTAQAPPAGLRAPLWWVGDTAAFPELASAKEVDGMRYADSVRGRLWTAAAWPPQDAGGARKLFEAWQQLHYQPVAFTAPSQVLVAANGAGGQQASGALREMLMIALAALFVLERILAHVRRR
ncbi:MAG: BatA domain-containing protein [Massilia sp.]